MTLVEEVMKDLDVDKDKAVEVLKVWEKDYNTLNDIVKNSKKSLKELCEELKGHNYTYQKYSKLFDLDYKSILATIHENDDKTLTLSGDIYGYYDNEEVKTLCNLDECLSCYADTCISVIKSYIAQ